MKEVEVEVHIVELLEVLSKDLLYEDLLKYFINPNNQSIKKSKPRMSTKEINIDSRIKIQQGYNWRDEDEIRPIY
ncbi:hypothetical protein GLOIN_2v1881828 [Rhizophagus irregularis DAOM 181602=DAOM 197198]|nr:hypothetical protein GLOIN_2v1881828 [Rhizophagus irregularis DAOM 181602=DAOM 197198]